MKTRGLFLNLILGLFAITASWAQDVNCTGKPVDLLILGDSQNGADWATSYFGNFFQKCLSTHPTGLSFVSYARGGTAPLDWIKNTQLDKVNTIFRDNEHNQVNLGTNALPVCKKRLKSLIEIHHPKKVLIFFGDNLLTNTPAEIKNQYHLMLQVLKQAGYGPKECLLVTPTYEMAIATKRNVSAKTVANTEKVLGAIKDEIGEACTVISGLQIMDNSPYLADQKLKRIGVEGTTGCFGAAANDNLHLCGESAQDFANRVCTKIEN
jgi:hypothetical protein